MPFKQNSTPTPEQTGVSLQLFAEASSILGVIVRVFVETASIHTPFPKAVNVNVTEPAAVSAALGVYLANVKEFWLVHVPVPLDVHSTLV